ncbi:MAG: hypothetical protein IPP52_08295 [Ignavibacteria bacterium]|nr:hypothetical protein [Ignavibacteria bacterium]
MEDKKYIVTLAGDDFEELKALSDKFNGENQTQQEVFTSTFDSKNYED